MSLPSRLPGPRRCPKKQTSKMPNFPIRDRNGPPPISRLSDDLLWRIFNLNTLTDTDLIEKFPSNPDFSLVTTSYVASVHQLALADARFFFSLG